MGQRGMGRRHVLWMYLGFAVAVGSIAAYALAATIWQAVLIGLVEGAGMTVGNVVWETLVHTHVPSRLMGRVSGFDWFVSMALAHADLVCADGADRSRAGRRDDDDRRRRAGRCRCSGVPPGPGAARPRAAGVRLRLAGTVGPYDHAMILVRGFAPKEACKGAAGARK